MRAHLIPRVSRPAVLAAALGLALGLGVPAMAQNPGAEDLRALIYYLDHNDQRSVQAEMRRLRAQFPRWTPPTDLNQLRALAPSAAAADVAGIWARIERADYAGARTMIDQTRAAVPGWSPDPEMLRLLDLNEGQAAFDAAVARRDHAAAITAARRVPALMRCDRINNAWQLAEMYQLAGQTANAVSTYRGILGSCPRLTDAMPTLEKANEIASLDDLTALFQVARQAAPASTPRLNELETRLRAGRGAAPLSGAQAGAAAAPSAQQASPAAPQQATAAPASPAPTATASAATAPATAGSLPLRGDSRLGQVRALKEAGNWAACLAASANPRSVEVLYERSWCAYNLERAGEALVGFRATAQVAASFGADMQRDANYGLMLSYLSFNMTEEAARLASVTNLTPAQRVEIESLILDQRGIRAFHLGEFEQSIAFLNALEQLSGALRRDTAMLRAYAYLNAGDRSTAHEQFLRLHRQLATEETRTAIQLTAGAEQG